MSEVEASQQAGAGPQQRQIGCLWAVYGAARELIDKREYEAAFRRIQGYRARAKAARFPLLLILEAQCIVQRRTPDDLANAVKVLEEAAELDRDNFWIQYNLGHHLARLGRHREALVAIGDSHRLVGWPESKEKGYEFTHDYFASNIPRWANWFDELIIAKPIDCLEIGSWQGASAVWLLDKIVSVRGGSLTCIDTFAGSSEHGGIVKGLGASLEAIFDSNIKRSGHQALCRKLVGPSQQHLRPLLPASYDFIYVDGAHEAKFVIQDAVLAWPLLRSGGFMLFDDYPYRIVGNPRQDTARAIDFFLEVFEDECQCVHKVRQVLLQKRI